MKRELDFARPDWFGQAWRAGPRTTWRRSVAGDSTMVEMTATSTSSNLSNSHILWRFLIGLHGGPRLLMVETASTKMVRSGGTAVVAGCAHARSHEVGALRLCGLHARQAGAVVVDGIRFQMMESSERVRKRRDTCTYIRRRCDYC